MAATSWTTIISASHPKGDPIHPPALPREQRRHSPQSTSFPSRTFSVLWGAGYCIAEGNDTLLVLSDSLSWPFCLESDPGLRVGGAHVAVAPGFRSWDWGVGWSLSTLTFRTTSGAEGGRSGSQGGPQDGPENYTPPVARVTVGRPMPGVPWVRRSWLLLGRGSQGKPP